MVVNICIYINYNLIFGTYVFLGELMKVTRKFAFFFCHRYFKDINEISFYDVTTKVFILIIITIFCFIYVISYYYFITLQIERLWRTLGMTTPYFARSFPCVFGKVRSLSMQYVGKGSQLKYCLPNL